MEEYIRKDKAKMFLCGICNEIHSDDPCEPSECVWMDDLERESAVIVLAPHGRWEWHEEYSNSTTEHYVELESCGWYCSHCGIELGDYLTKRTGETIYLDDESRKPFLNRCPNCGFIMDLEDEDHD